MSDLPKLIAEEAKELFYKVQKGLHPSRATKQLSDFLDNVLSRPEKPSSLEKDISEDCRVRETFLLFFGGHEDTLKSWCERIAKIAHDFFIDRINGTS